MNAIPTGSFAKHGSVCRSWIVAAATILVLAAFTPPASAQFLGPAIQGELSRTASNAKSEALKQRLKDIAAAYAKTAYSPIWISGGKPTAKAEQMVDALNLAYEDGLHPDDYDAVQLFQKLGATNAAGLADLEVHLTTAAVSYAQHMNSGRLNPRQVNREIVIYPKAIATETILANMRKTQNIKAYVRLIAPRTQRYERLRQALAAYRRIEAVGGFIKVPEGPAIKAGAADARISTIRQRLAQEGFLRGGGGGLVYDAALVDAVKRFQEQHGLKAEGLLGPQTIKEMNISASARVLTLELNMERNRWLQNEFAPYHVFANLADQVVKLVKNDDTLHAEVIQVGQPYFRTPVFTDVMETIEFNPYWNVPPSIAVNEYLPKLRKNPGVLSGENIKVLSGNGAVSATAVNWSSLGKGNFPYSLRQDPGPGNALGRVKFLFPNEYNVYMHDTPSKAKFDAAQRYFSHGCLRLRDPLKMAELILGPEGYSRQRIEQIVASGKNTPIRLKTPIPVYVVYLTAFVNKDGSVHYRDDAYGRDKILAEALSKVRGR